jgi:hypothetical protein
LGSSNDIRFTVIVSPEHLWEYIMPWVRTLTVE